MDRVLRLFVEKKEGFDVEAKGKLADLKENLLIGGLKDLRLLNRYDVSGLYNEDFEKAKTTIFSEPNADDVYDEEFSYNKSDKVFAVEYLPGQYDQRADSAAQCVQLLTAGERPEVASAQVYVLSGDISDAEFEKIKKYIINPVESREASMDKPETLKLKYAVPTKVATVEGFIGWSDKQVEEYFKTMGFAMTVKDLIFCRDYFKNDEHRDPTVTELKVIDTYWSDHCRHTTFLTKLDKIEIEKGGLSSAIENSLEKYYSLRKEIYGDREKAVSLMDMATIGGKYLYKNGLVPDLDISEEINACSIEAPVEVDGRTEQWLIQFKNETHNHPTEIEPFGGAATCLGGAIRDPLSGRAYVYQAMRVTGSGDPTLPVSATIEGKLPQRKITTTAAHGYSSYGNQIGLATGQVTELYDAGYTAKRLEIGAVVGASPKENVVRGVPAAGDIIVLLGGRTGRDGCGGATGSSKAHTKESLVTCGAEVQKGNPPTERKIQRLFRDPDVAKLIKRCNDFGAGGVCVAIGELADGLTISLNNVRKKYDGLDGTELAISESQERMAVVLSPEDVDKFIAKADGENLEAYPVAVVTESPRLVMNWNDDTIVDLSREFLNTNGVTQNSEAFITAPKAEDNYRDNVPACLENMDVSDAFIKNLSRLEVCSQKGLSERFDSSIGAATVLMPFAGKYQLTPEEAMVAKVPLLHGETDTATAMSYGYVPGHTKFSPFHGSAYAVVESLSKLAAVGADTSKARLTFQEYFERLYDKSERWGKPAAALLGALTAQVEMGVPAIGGKDSMSGSFNELDVPPTLVSFALSMTTASKTVSACAKNAGDKIYVLFVPENNETKLPDWCKLKALYSYIKSLSDNGKIVAASVVHEGGCAAAVSKMCFGNKLGFDFNNVDKKTLFAPLSGSVVIEVSTDTVINSEFEYAELGTVTDNSYFTVDGKRIEIETLVKAWENTLEPVFPSYSKQESVCRENALFTERNTKAPAIKSAKPRVLIPVFPGTNCEVDTARAFEKAGAIPEIVVVKNLTPAAIEETIEKLSKSIDNSQIVMLPGGFSGGDEPDGSGKFIATTFRNKKIAKAVSNLLDNRDGLMLGICNGFQALIKLGLVPYGRITEINEDDPTLTFNYIGRHVSRMAYTRVTSVKSPWLCACEAGDVFAIPVSHGEGRFAADEKCLKALEANGQIATQYVTPEGVPSSSIVWNPNGSAMAIEGITSPDGRVLGKMGHSERKGENLYKNVPGNKDQKLFESGVKYFK